MDVSFGNFADSGVVGVGRNGRPRSLVEVEGGWKSGSRVLGKYVRETEQEVCPHS